MKIFKCPKCASPIFFENTKCEHCNALLGFNPQTDTFEQANATNSKGNGMRFCQNYQFNICNWFINQHDDSNFCVACKLNRKVPSIHDTENFVKWKRLETAKHRLVYQLLKFQLPLVPKGENSDGLAFDFVSKNNEDKAVTGHADGVITILLSEADSVHREQLRKQMNEPYRTLLGHFRHEIGHYYWTLLFRHNNLENFRGLFGNEQLDYSEALNAHYNQGAPANWNAHFISKYANSHPWEDWAETWAHYLHVMDGLETANAFGMSFEPEEDYIKTLLVSKCPNPYKTSNFQTVIDASIALTCTGNSLNRSMGLPDIYPFVIPKPVTYKLNFIHGLLSDYNKNKMLIS